MEDVGAAFWEASRAVRARRERVLRTHGVHAGQDLLLERLWREDGLTPGELAERIGVETPTVTRMAQRMERAGLVRRVKSTADRRLVRVHLTAAGLGLRSVLPALIARAGARARDCPPPRERARSGAPRGRVPRTPGGRPPAAPAPPKCAAPPLAGRPPPRAHLDRPGEQGRAALPGVQRAVVELR